MSRSNLGKKRGAQPRPSAGGGNGKPWLFFACGLALGVAIPGAFYLFKILPTAMELHDKEQTLAAECADASGKKKPDAGNADEAAADKKPVTFDFYNMLPSQKVVPPTAGRDGSGATPPAAVAPPAAALATAAQPAPTAPIASVAPTTASPAPVAATPAAANAAISSAPGSSKPPVAAATPPAKPAASSSRYALQAGSFATRAEADRRRGELLLSGLDVNVQQATTDKGDTRFRVMVGPFGNEAAMQKARQQLGGMKVDTMPVRIK